MLTEDQRMQMMYTGLANCFCAERALAWSRSQLLAVVNIAGLPVIGVSTSTNRDTSFGWRTWSCTKYILAFR